MVKDRHLKSVKSEQVHSDPSLGTLPSLCNLYVCILGQSSMDFCLVNLCNHLFHPQQLRHGVPQFIFISCEGPSSSVRFELISWEISNPSVCSPWHFSSWFTGSMMSAKNQAQYSPGCPIRLWKLLEYFRIACRKYLCLYLWVQCLPSFLSTTVLLTSLHLPLPLNHYPTPHTHAPFSAGLHTLFPSNKHMFFYSSTNALVLVNHTPVFPLIIAKMCSKSNPFSQCPYHPFTNLRNILPFSFMSIILNTTASEQLISSLRVKHLRLTWWTLFFIQLKTY